MFKLYTCNMYITYAFGVCGTVRKSDACVWMCVGTRDSVCIDIRRLCVFGVVGAGGPKKEDWGVIQSLHKWIWLIEGASDPDWCTAGAPLIGEGEEWRRE